MSAVYNIKALRRVRFSEDDDEPRGPVSPPVKPARVRFEASLDIPARTSDKSTYEADLSDDESESQLIDGLSLHDVLNEAVDRRTISAGTTDENPCKECAAMLRSCLGFSASPRTSVLSSSMISAEDDRCFETNLSVHTLEQKADECEICGLLLAICRGTDGLFLYQSKAYEDDAFNPISRYDENGISDHEAAHFLYGRRKRASMTLQVKLQRAQVINERSKLSMHLALELWTQTKERVSYGQPLIELFRALPVFLLGHPSQSIITNMGVDLDYRLGPSQKLQTINSWVRRQLSLPRGPMTDFPTRLLYFPTRDRVRLVQYLDLIDIHEEAGSRSNILPNNIPRIPYAALSHRWGKSKHLTATTHNWEELQADFPIWRLPKTFRDAILLTQQLDIRYLWIDAMCILQDSASDWLYESERMGDIFLNASFTIAVHNTRDDADEFFKDAFSKRTAITYDLGPNRIGICLPPDFQQDVTSSGLSRRAWVLQERFLSERTIHITSGQIYLESNDGILCEDGTLLPIPTDLLESGSNSQHSGRETYAYSTHSPYELRNLRRLFGLEVRKSPHPNAHAAAEIRSAKLDAAPTTLEWLHLVEMYSYCSLTFEADKLIALAGMARKVQDATRQVWCAGIWADHICQSLLWTPTNTGITAPQYRRAPSWSWASWDGPIQFPKSVWDPNFRPRCFFLSVRAEDSRKASPHWLDEDGTMTVRGRLLSLSGSRFNDCVILGPGPPRRSVLEKLPRTIWKSYVSAHGVFDEADDPVGFGQFDPRRPKPHGWAIFDHIHTQLLYDEKRNRNDPTVFLDKPTDFLILGTCGFGENELCLGLLLQRVRVNEQLMYNRLGIGHMNWRKTAHDYTDEEGLFNEAKLDTVTMR